jgi:hypothetical protein
MLTRFSSLFLLCAVVAAASAPPANRDSYPPNYVAGSLVRLNDNGAWSYDNLRPLVPAWDDPRTALVWMRGTYVHNHGEWYTSVVALILPPDERG